MGKVGPKDGSDYVGGNYISTINATSTVPNILANLINQLKRNNFINMLEKKQLK